jgi:hypothetical protein
MIRPLLILVVSTFLTACVTSTPAPPPTATPRPAGPATEVLLPWHTNDQVVGRVAYEQLKACLTRTGVFEFAARPKVETTIDNLGVDIRKTFGPSDEDFKAVGQALDVQYVLGGAFTILKSLTFSGWRKDITSDIRLHYGDNGREAGYWRSNTGFTWTRSETATNAEKMSARRVFRIPCHWHSLNIQHVV